MFELYKQGKQVPKEKQKFIEEYKEREQFFKKFLESLIVVDPLDRVDPTKYTCMEHPAVKSID